MIEHPIWSFAYTKPSHAILMGTTTTVAFFSNSLLIYIVATTKADHIGAYRYLLVFFAICNITTSIGHLAFQWVHEYCCHMTSIGFYFFPKHLGSIVFGVSTSSIFCWMFIVTYYQVFLILAFHFIYRYKTVTRGFGNSFTDNWKMKHWILAAMIAYVLYIGAFVSTVAIGMAPDAQNRADVPEIVPEIIEIYGMDLTDERTGYIYLGMRRVDPVTKEMYWSAQSTIAISLCVLLFGGTGAVVVYCIVKTNAAIKSETNLLTSTTRRMQRQLFKALLVQTTIPCLFSYTPLLVILLWGGLTGIALGSFGNALFVITAIFPSVDSFFVLFFIAKFRAAVVKLFGLPARWAKSGSSVEAPRAPTTTAFTK
ncbi:hypothetical protein PRIPAC_97925 [Pristionchus pacificus]|uniref:G protein-coupled receptor n=1 Tax=Pristionchus pacificus TaxID=54126 RepID=A0A2A6D1X5_PRIPA|nr:hypothetical protein PRIPAC_97925 [Pristionchus pacificus]|eukprot:PDM84415.1 G protein-coupled receptor [Pristionchus pacificus]